MNPCVKVWKDHKIKKKKKKAQCFTLLKIEDAFKRLSI